METIRMWRCCMCPNSEGSDTCPAGHTCEFVKTWVSKAGTQYKIMKAEVGIYTVFYKRKNTNNWKENGRFSIKTCFDWSQEMLNLYARKHDWKPQGVKGNLEWID